MENGKKNILIALHVFYFSCSIGICSRESNGDLKKIQIAIHTNKFSSYVLSLSIKKCTKNRKRQSKHSVPIKQCTYTLPYDKRLKMAESEEAESLGQLVPGLDQLEPGDGGGERVLAVPPHQHQGVSCHTQQPH